MRTIRALLLLLAASCTFVEATSTQYVGVTKYPRSDPDKVAVLAAEPKQRHERLGEVMLDISVEPKAPLADIEDKLREEAAKLGADAIYVARDSISRREGHRLIGIAIRYVR
jgi:hypothetical protein